MDNQRPLWRTCFEEAQLTSIKINYVFQTAEYSASITQHIHLKSTRTQQTCHTVLTSATDHCKHLQKGSPYKCKYSLNFLWLGTLWVTNCLLQATEMMKPMSHISLLLLQPISQLWPQENTKLTIQFYLVPIFKLPSPFIFISHGCVILELPYQTAYQTINFTFCNAISLPTV